MAYKYNITDYGFGQLGSIFCDGANTPIEPPLGKVFVAITMVDDTKFNTTGGLVADNMPELGLEYIGNLFARDVDGTVNDAAHDDVANPTATTGTGGKVVDAANSFPRGLTIYGRWTEIDLSSGSIIAYIGE